jgi:hypothetical protein
MGVIDSVYAIYSGGQFTRATLNQWVQGSSPWWITIFRVGNTLLPPLVLVETRSIERVFV